MNNSEGTVYVIEDDEAFRESVAFLLQASGFETEKFDCAESFLSNAVIRAPGCLLLDVCLPDIDGLSLQQRLAQKAPDLPIVFMTGHGDIPMTVKALKNGAIDFLPKPFKSGDLLDAIKNALERNVQNVQVTLEKKTVKDLINTLTPREKEVLRWIITGKLNKQISFELGISEITIKIHRGRVMSKTGASSVADLVRLAEKAGITPAE